MNGDLKVSVCGETLTESPMGGGPDVSHMHGPSRARTPGPGVSVHHYNVVAMATAW